MEPAKDDQQPLSISGSHCTPMMPPTAPPREEQPVPIRGAPAHLHPVLNDVTSSPPSAALLNSTAVSRSPHPPMIVGGVCYYYGGPAACIALPPAKKVGCTVTTPDPPKESFIIVPESKIVKVRVSMQRAQKGKLIGKSGANIKSIEGMHGVRVRVNDDATSFTVRGTRTAVADAVEACRGLLKVPPSMMKPTRTPLQKAREVMKREIERGDLAIAPTPKHNLMDFLVPGSKKANRANKV